MRAAALSHAFYFGTDTFGDSVDEQPLLFLMTAF